MSSGALQRTYTLLVTSRKRLYFGRVVLWQKTHHCDVVQHQNISPPKRKSPRLATLATISSLEPLADGNSPKAAAQHQAQDHKTATGQFPLALLKMEQGVSCEIATHARSFAGIVSSKVMEMIWMRGGTWKKKVKPSRCRFTAVGFSFDDFRQGLLSFCR